jgi:hypothetical protein
MAAHVRSLHKRIAVLAAIPVALVASGAIVWEASYSAFTAKDNTAVNNWAAGTVSLSDDAASAMFSVTNMKPGTSTQKCVVVTSNGSLPSAVKLYGSSYATTNNLAGSITLLVEEGTGGSFAGGCTGFTIAGTATYNGLLSAFGAKTTYATGVGTWAPTGTPGETRTYRITATLSSSAPDTVQGGTAAIAFTWEAQNT